MNENAKKFCGKEKYTFEDLCEIVSILRGKDGCPWDMEQTHKSIRKGFIEETYEVIEAIDNEDPVLLREELGDVMLQVVFHSDIEREEKRFDISDVITDECKKLVFRHPHIFSDTVAETTDEVLDNWEKLKSEEKKRKTTSMKLHAVPASLPALMRADKLGSVSKKAGFDFDSEKDAFAKVKEELLEVEDEMTGGNKEKLTEEIGDLLLATVNTARLCGINAEEALTFACDKYCRRYEALEAELVKRNLNSAEMTQTELDAIWDEIKHNCDK